MNIADARFRKVVTIGWDGADWRFLRPWIEAGELPTLARLVAGGVHGNLRSTIRPESSVAWASFSTGTNPGQHGVYGFAGRQIPGSYEMPLTNASSIRIPRFWDVLGQHKYQVCLLNIPYTYPPAPVSGWLVGGMLTPSAESDFTFPPDLKAELLHEFGSYIPDVTGPQDDKIQLFENVRTFTDQQSAMTFYLLENKQWDYFCVVFVGPDRLQHFLWEHDAQTPGGSSSRILAHYRTLDDILSKILHRIPSDSLVLLLSDHGFNGCSRKFYVNQWLHSQGFLDVTSTQGIWTKVMNFASRLHRIPLLRAMRRRFGSQFPRLSDLRSASFVNTVRWSRTKAYFGLDGGLHINLKGREPEGIVAPGAEYKELRESLRQRLLALVDPSTGHPVVSAVFFREDIYSGLCTDLAPDIIVEPHRENDKAPHNFILDGAVYADPTLIFSSSAPYSANHASEGIFCAWGPGIRENIRIEGAQIVDIAPTLLGAMGCEIPKHMDGHVLDIFNHPLIPRKSANNIDIEEYKPLQESKKGDDQIRQRLRDLGYL